MKDKVIIGGADLKIEDIIAVARFGARVELSEQAKERVIRSREVVDSIISNNEVVYGVTTGCGPMVNRLIPLKDAKQFHTNLVRSHCSGVGEVLPVAAIRATMLTRANSMSRGYSGVQPETLRTLVRMINRGIHPLIPNIGSVGASGDLVHLAHLALGLIGEGKVEYKGKIVDAKEAFKKEKIKPAQLSYKEGLVCINGTSCMNAIGAIAIHDAENILKTAQIAAAMSLEAMHGSLESFDSWFYKVNSKKIGQSIIAKNMRKLLDNSKLITTAHEIGLRLKKQKSEYEVTHADEYLQDPYTLRCIPHILGPVRDSIMYAKDAVSSDFNSVSDNPFVIPETGQVLHGGNFHGQSVSIAMDLLKIVLTEIGILSERRLARLLDEKLNLGLPPFLVHHDPGFNSGFMGIQYVPSSLVAENRVLSTPTSIQTVSTNANNQDVVSMGTVASRQATNILQNVERIVAVELLCAAQALDLRGVENAGTASGAAHKAIRDLVPILKSDRYLSSDIEKVIELIHSRKIVDEVEEIVGPIE